MSGINSKHRLSAGSRFEAAEFVAASDELAEVLGALSASDWNALAEAPPGHISVSALCHHAIWDSWVHERDIFVPLGATDAPLDDEMLVSLRYVAALGPGLALTRGETRRGELCHWAAIASAPVFVLWNPWWGDTIILAQRYNRARFRRLLGRIRTTS